MGYKEIHAPSVDALKQRIAALEQQLVELRGKVREFMDDAGVVFDEPRLRYIEVQVSRELWNEMRTEAGSDGK